MKSPLKTLIYKRTHRGDPDDSGRFGINHCMGRVRGYDFEAVIGVGGKRPDRGHEEIAMKVNWIGIGPEKVVETKKGPVLQFEIFRRLDEVGPTLQDRAPELFSYMFVEKHVRYVLSQNLPKEEMQREVQRLLRWAEEGKNIPKPGPIPAKKKNDSAKCGC